MTSLSHGLTLAGFCQSPERLSALVAALRTADFDFYEDLKGASRLVCAFLTVFTHVASLPFVHRLCDAPMFANIPREDIEFVEFVAQGGTISPVCTLFAHVSYTRDCILLALYNLIGEEKV